MASRDRSLSPERVYSSNSIQDGDSRLGAALCPRGRFPSFRGFEGHVFSNTRSSVLTKAIAFHVGGDSLPVQGPVLSDCRLPPQVFTRVFAAMSAWAHSRRDSSSPVPGQLAGPCLLGGSGQTTCPGTALALSLSGDCDKRREVQSRALAVCNILGHDHRYRSRQCLSHPCAGGIIPLGGGAVPCCDRYPRSAVAGAVGAPVIAGEAGSSRASSNALPAVAFEDSLVPRVGSSFSTSASVTGGGGGPVLVDGEGSPSHGGLFWDACYGSSPVFGRISVGVGRTPPRLVCVQGVVGAGRFSEHQSPGDEGPVPGLAVLP